VSLLITVGIVYKMISICSLFLIALCIAVFVDLPNVVNK